MSFKQYLFPGRPLSRNLFLTAAALLVFSSSPDSANAFLHIPCDARLNAQVSWGTNSLARLYSPNRENPQNVSLQDYLTRFYLRGSLEFSMPEWLPVLREMRKDVAEFHARLAAGTQSLNSSVYLANPLSFVPYFNPFLLQMSNAYTDGVALLLARLDAAIADEAPYQESLLLLLDTSAVISDGIHEYPEPGYPPVPSNSATFAALRLNYLASIQRKSFQGQFFSLVNHSLDMGDFVRVPFGPTYLMEYDSKTKPTDDHFWAPIYQVTHDEAHATIAEFKALGKIAEYLIRDPARVGRVIVALSSGKVESDFREFQAKIERLKQTSPEKGAAAERIAFAHHHEQGYPFWFLADLFQDQDTQLLYFGDRSKREAMNWLVENVPTY